MGKKINIRPTSGVYATYKRLSYEPWTAIAEFVDNSTQSFYEHKDELMAIKYSKGLTITIDYIEDAAGDRIEITDNAYGMEWSEFQRAVVLDKIPPNTKGRNEFGMGLKTAACWFGSFWSVESTQLNSKNKYYTELNVEELGKYKFEEIDVIEETVGTKEHYTKIIIKNLNKKINASRTVGKIKELLGSIYRQDLRRGFVKIYYNGTSLQFKEAPIYEEALTDGSTKQWKNDVKFNISHEDKILTVTGFIAIRIPASLKDAGFTLLRRGRVIVGGSEKNYRPVDIFGDSNSYPYQRLFGELNLDNWPVTQAKDNFDWHNSGLEEKFIEELKNISQEYCRKADNIRIREKINTNELINTALGDLSKSGVVDDVKIEIVDAVEDKPVNTVQADEKTLPSEQSNLSNENEVVDTKGEGVILDGGSKAKFYFKHKGRDYIFNIYFDLSNPSAHWLLVEENSASEYTLSINMKHSFFKPLIEKKDFMPIMMKMSVALVIAEIDSRVLSPEQNGKINASDIRIKMNEILEDVRKGDIIHE